MGFLENAPADGAGCYAEPCAVLRISHSVPVPAADPNPLSRRGFHAVRRGIREWSDRLEERGCDRLGEFLIE